MNQLCLNLLKIQFFAMSSSITSAITLAKRGGAAFTTCFICEVLFPWNTKVSGKDWMRAASLTVIALFKKG